MLLVIVNDNGIDIDCGDINVDVKLCVVMMQGSGMIGEGGVHSEGRGGGIRG